MYVCQEHLQVHIMRNLIFIALMATLSLSAQQKEAPKFTLEGKLTKVVTYHENGEIAQTGFLKKINFTESGSVLAKKVKKLQWDPTY